MSARDESDELMRRAVRHGRDGRDGHDGRDGSDGQPGERGERGPAGPMLRHAWEGTALRLEKAPGVWEESIDLRGEPGKPGQDGRDGVNGKDGSPGSDGKRGARGEAGKAGEMGPRGPMGPMPKHQWDDTQLRFELGRTTEGKSVWGEWVDLQGPPGKQGPMGFGGGGGGGGGGGDLTQEQADLRYLKLEGGTLTGALVLNANPVGALEAATKQYVDSHSGGGSGSANTILSGSGAPTGAVGEDGDFYIDATSHVIYGPKVAGAWGAGTSLIGPAGPQGPTGATGAEGATGPMGATGPQGVQGLQGVQGAPGTAGATGPAGPQGIQGPVGPEGPQGPAGVGVSDHGLLIGLTDDDHPQYHTNARGDARYWQLSTDLATQAEFDAHIAAADPHPQYLTQAEADALYGGSTSAQVWLYKFAVNTAAGDPSPGLMRINHLTPASATQMYVDSLTDDGINIDVFIPNAVVGTVLLVQQRTIAANFQRWRITTAPVNNTGWWTFGVTLVGSGGAGTTGFAGNTNLIITAQSAGTYVPLTGGTMTGPLILSGDPAVPLGAATKQYVDAHGGFSSPLTTKGDVHTYSTTDARLAVGADGLGLIADSTQPTGLKWGTVSGGGGSSPLTTKGDLFGRNASADARLPVGTDGQVVRADAAQTLGVKWSDSNSIHNGTGAPPAGLGYPGDFYIQTDCPDSGVPVDKGWAFKNALMNANFRINQRGYVSGTATTGANQYTLDRWRVVTSGQSLTFAASGNGNQITAPAGGVEQVIEGVNIRGGTYTLNWTGTATATVNGSAVAKGANISLPANTNATVRFSSGTVSEVQLELGSSASDFSPVPFDVEIERCKRYYRKSFNYAVTPTQAAGSVTGEHGFSQCVGGSTQQVSWVSFGGELRAAPVITLFNPNAANAELRHQTGGLDWSGTAATGPSTKGFRITATSPASSNPGALAGIHWTADAEL